jgi:hypothetical protein
MRDFLDRSTIAPPLECCRTGEPYMRAGTVRWNADAPGAADAPKCLRIALVRRMIRS